MQMWDAVTVNSCTPKWTVSFTTRLCCIIHRLIRLKVQSMLQPGPFLKQKLLENLNISLIGRTDVSITRFSNHFHSNGAIESANSGYWSWPYYQHPSHKVGWIHYSCKMCLQNHHNWKFTSSTKCQQPFVQNLARWQQYSTAVQKRNFKQFQSQIGRWHQPIIKSSIVRKTEAKLRYEISSLNDQIRSTFRPVSLFTNSNQTLFNSIVQFVSNFKRQHRLSLANG